MPFWKAPNLAGAAAERLGEAAHIHDHVHVGAAVADVGLRRG